MSVRTIACAACMGLLLAPAAVAAGTLDVLPAPGGAPARLHVAQTIAGPDGPQIITSAIELRRTGPGSAVIVKDGQLTPLVIDSAGALRPADASPQGTQDPSIVELLAALDVARAVAAAPDAGDRNGWTAQIPVPPRRPPGAADDSGAPAPSPSPAAPLQLPIRTIAANVTGAIDIDGSVETTLTAPASAARQQRSRSSGGFGGGMGGFGGRGGRGGGGYGGDSGPVRGPAAPPVTLDVHVSGRIAHGALTHVMVAQTRRIIVDGLTYTNAGSWTFDAVH